MIITGCRQQEDLMAQLSDTWYDANNWHYWFSLTPGAIKSMDIAQLAGDESALTSTFVSAIPGAQISHVGATDHRRYLC